MNSVSERIAKLPPAKLQLLTQRLEIANANRKGASQITRRTTAGARLPLSFAQQRLWFLDQLFPGNPIYNIPLVVKMEGQLDVDALEQALNEIVRRHEVLRTHFETVERQGVQIIAPDVQVQIAVTDLSAVDDAERVAAELMAEEARQPFDLSAIPLLRARLLRLGAEQHLALLTLHHIISDGWSMSILIGELAALYQAYRQKEESPLRELRLQYADYAVWQREWLQGRVLEEELSYWRKQLSGAPPVLQLPADHERPEQPSYRGKRHEVRVSAEESDRLRELSRSEGVTLFMLLLAVYEVLLSYLTGADDVVVGTDVANRTRAETEGMIGFFVNQLVLRVKVAEAESFRELVRRVREVALAAYEHQDVPFEKVVEAVRPQRSVSYAPLFQVKFILNNWRQETLELLGLTISPLKSADPALDFDLLLMLMDQREGLQGHFHYNADLFEPATISRMFHLFETLLSSIVKRPDTNVSELKQILAETDRQRELQEEEELRQARLQKIKQVRRRRIS